MKKLIFTITLLIAQSGFCDVIYLNAKDLKGLETNVVKIKDDFPYYHPTPAAYEMTGNLQFVRNGAVKTVQMQQQSASKAELALYAQYLESITNEVEEGRIYRTYDDQIRNYSTSYHNNITRIGYSQWWPWYNSITQNISYSVNTNHVTLVRCYKAQKLIIDVTQQVWNSADIGYREVVCPKDMAQPL